MADTKISALTSATTPLAGTEVLPIVQSSTTKKVAVSDLTAGRTISASGVTVTGLTASYAVATDGSKNLTSVANTGTGNNVLSSSPTGGGDWTISGTYAVSQSNGWYVTNGESQTGATGYGVSLRLVSDGSGNYDGRIVVVSSGTAYTSLKFGATEVTVAEGNLVFGTAGKGIQFAGNSGVLWRCGAGTPEGAVTAPIGSLYTRTDGGAGTTLYVKESGSGNTGWVAK